MSPICLLAAQSGPTAPDRALDPALASRAVSAGFDGVVHALTGPIAMYRPDASSSALTGAATGLRLVLAVDLAAFAPDDPIVAAHPALFSQHMAQARGAIDPRAGSSGATPVARLQAEEAETTLAPILADQLIAAARSGVGGFVLIGAERFGTGMARAIVQRLRSAVPDTLILAQGGLPAMLAGLGLNGWITADDASALAQAAPAWRGTPILAQATAESLLAQTAMADGLVVSDTLWVEQPERIARALALVREAAPFSGARRWSSGVALRAASPDWRAADQLLEVAANDGTIDRVPASIAVPGFAPARLPATLAPGEAVATVRRRAAPVVVALDGKDASNAADRPRLVVEQIAPGVDDGAFPVKRIAGEPVTVTAAVFADGHEQLAADLLWRAADEREWRRVTMEQLPNDGWRASFVPDRVGRHEFAVEGWLDRFGGFHRDFGKKLAAGVAQSVDHREGRLLVEQAASRSSDPALAAVVQQIDAAPDDARVADLLLSPELKMLMRAGEERLHVLRSAPQPLDAERIEARFSSWYELFPRSITDDVRRHGTFRDVIGRLPAIRDMGFDTLYFPPIHPIGKTNRKGPNNTLTPGPDDPGSPYAIGSADGGHEAIHPELGSFEDFAALIDAARDHGLEIAIDFAIQCSPDHPWLKEHPGWFAWRPDGSMKYAENPPKKYQDIVNVDFYGPDAVPELWTSLRDIVLLWVDRGVKTFRVDNPHTKPLPFWEWMIGEVRGAHPEVIFLAEAFTRPNMMYRLAKIGFSQSYTYFTWRDTKRELTDYIVELTTTAPRDFYRPHFFVNTPDINPVFLQTSGRPGFRIRAVLAATLSGLFGVYSGFELCEAAPIPGKEEYLDSEKFEVRPRDWQAPGNIIADITLLNRLRRDNPALQTHLNTVFCDAGNDRIIYYGKPAPDGSELILVMVSLDPFGPQETGFDVPLWRLGTPDDGSVDVEDLAEGYRFRWYGRQQTIRLLPDQPFRIWRIRP